MTGIHHAAPATYLRATRRHEADTTGVVRRPGRLLQTIRRFTGRPPAAGLPRWVDVVPSPPTR